MLAAPTLVNLDGDIGDRLRAIPGGAGVGQILGDEGRSLVIGRPASLRRWAASHLGAGRPPRPGKRPPTDLRPVARTISFTTTSSAFHQRLVFERLMARHVPRSARRDLKPPAYLHLDPGDRFPRLTVRGAVPAGSPLPGLFGPFRNRRAAARALAALHKLFPLRPCDYEFQPAADLALGLGCVYAQVHTCAAPCLTRVTEEAYRGLAAQAARFLAKPPSRPEATLAWMPAWVCAADSRAVVIEDAPERLEVYPIMAGTVLDDHIATADPKDIEDVLGGLKWTGPNETGHDRDWLAGWMYTPKRTGRYVVLDGDGNESALVRRAMEQAPHVR